jgi:TPM domain
MDLLPEAPPPLLPILDAAGILNGRDVWKIEAARDKLRRRFPQFQWRVCTVMLPAETHLSVFGFWLLNVCPLHGTESAEDRAATVLLLINAGIGQVAAVPGYAVESCLSDDGWKAILATMAAPWRDGQPVEAVIRFFKNTRIRLEGAWKSYGARNPAR